MDLAGVGQGQQVQAKRKEPGRFQRGLQPSWEPLLLGPVGGKRMSVAILEVQMVVPSKEGGLCGEVPRLMEEGVESSASCPLSRTPTLATTGDPRPVESPFRGEDLASGAQTACHHVEDPPPQTGAPKHQVSLRPIQDLLSLGVGERGMSAALLVQEN